jgi:hypothetical protein
MDMNNEIVDREAELRPAQLASDVEVLERILDDLLVFTNFDGTLATKDCIAPVAYGSHEWSQWKAICSTSGKPR